MAGHGERKVSLSRDQQFIVQSPLQSKEGWLWLKEENHDQHTKYWVKVEWPNMQMGETKEWIEGKLASSTLIRQCTFRRRQDDGTKRKEKSFSSKSSLSSSPSRSPLDSQRGSRISDELIQLSGTGAYIICVQDNLTLQQHEICVSGKTDHNEWLTVLREHSAHHSIFNAYDVSKHLVGKGRYAEVYLGRDMLTRKRHALKMIKKANIDTNCDSRDIHALKNEILISKSLTHTNTVHFTEFVETNETFVLIMEFIGGGNLFDHVERERPDENAVCHYARQILCGLDQLHALGICHRDIKPENILVTSDKPPIIKLADFGISCKVSADAPSTSLTDDGSLRCSPGYGAPEILKQEPYGLPCDLWSLGATIYYLLTALQPFVGLSDIETRQLMLVGMYNAAPLDKFSVHARDIISRLLVLNPEERITAEAARKHDWLAQLVPHSEADVHASPRKSINWESSRRKGSMGGGAGLLGCFGMWATNRIANEFTVASPLATRAGLTADSMMMRDMHKSNITDTLQAGSIYDSVDSRPNDQSSDRPEVLN